MTDAQAKTVAIASRRLVVERAIATNVPAKVLTTGAMKWEYHSFMWFNEHQLGLFYKIVEEKASMGTMITVYVP